jgi:alkanesulfonate monooxygenase SsuD/methylene tetrahydromethanopterin reductase-like flavin-dependent oxidoreductase (luciferase family)
VTGPRFALVLLLERIADCAGLAAAAERAGFKMLGLVDSQMGPGGNGHLTDRWGLTEYLAERFAIAGTPDDCAAQVRRAVAAGAGRLLLTGITPDPHRFIERWATEVMPRCRAEGPVGGLTWTTRAPGSGARQGGDR